MPPPPAETIASRLFLGPALRTQPDRRLVTLVHGGYEAAFEEIVRRYGRPLHRYAAAIVGGRAEDVTQDAFSKALLALRRDTEVELRPWLYRIVRNTALNDLRDQPPATRELDEAMHSGESALDAAERREEVAELMARLQALPEPQRAAIVMRELEGLSHEEIAAALGLSGGAARQAIYRARRALRDGVGMLLPLPLLKALLAGGTAPVEAATGAGAGSVVGAGVALKATAATVLLAGTVGAGVALQHDRHRNDRPAAAGTIVERAPSQGSSLAGPPIAGSAAGGESSSRRGSGDGRGGKPEPGDDRGEQGNGSGESGTESDGEHGGGGGSSSGHGSSGHDNGNGGGNSGSGGRGGEDRSEPSRHGGEGPGSSEIGEGPGPGSSSGASHSGRGPGSPGDGSGTEEGSGSENGGPHSGGGEPSNGSNSGGSRDSRGGDVSSEQTDQQSKEDE